MDVVQIIVTGGKVVCKIVEYGTGEDVCGMLETLATNVKYNVMSYLEKNSNCNHLIPNDTIWHHMSTGDQLFKEYRKFC